MKDEVQNKKETHSVIEILSSFVLEVLFCVF